MYGISNRIHVCYEWHFFDILEIFLFFNILLYNKEKIIFSSHDFLSKNTDS